MAGFSPVGAGTGDAPPHGNCPRLTAVAPFYFDDWTHRRAALEPLILALRCWDLPRAHDLLDDYRPALAGFTAPTLVIGGRRDWRFPIAWQRATADALPHATFVVVEHSGHLPHVEQPADFARAIIAWLPAAR